MLRQLADAGLAERLHRLPFDYAEYDPVTDGPRLSFFEPRWVVTKGYDAAHSFFEVDESGASTRNEVFLVTPSGYLEIGAFGITGWNKNPRYIFRPAATKIHNPRLHFSGMGFGLERLLLAERILGSL